METAVDIVAGCACDQGWQAPNCSKCEQGFEGPECDQISCGFLQNCFGNGDCVLKNEKVFHTRHAYYMI